MTGVQTCALPIWIFSLSLLATVRGGTSFLCPKRQRNEAKKTLSNHATLSVHSVQFLFMGAPKVRCSPEPRMCETLLLANSYTHTLRPVRSRASTIAKKTRPVSHVFVARVFRGLAARFALSFLGLGPRILRPCPDGCRRDSSCLKILLVGFPRIARGAL